MCERNGKIEENHSAGPYLLLARWPAAKLGLVSPAV